VGARGAHVGFLGVEGDELGAREGGGREEEDESERRQKGAGPHR
jgi:hypothetical protein